VTEKVDYPPLSSGGGAAAMSEAPAVDSDIDSDLDAKTIPLRHRAQWVVMACLLVFAAMFVHSLFANPNYQWSVVGHYFFSPIILSGVLLTIELTVIGMSISVVIGIGCAVMRLSTNRLLTGASVTYIWFFRACPLMVQLIFWYNLSAVYPRLGLGIPFGPQFVTFSANSLITPMMAAILGLSLYEGAYMAEIVRGGILAIEAGQAEAAQSLGMPRGLTLRRIVLPQAMRVIIPPTGNELIGMLKNTALVSVIALSELLYTAQSIYMRTYQEIPLLIVVIIWYLLIVSVLSVGQYYLERHYGRGQQGQASTGLVGYATVLRRYFTFGHHDMPGQGRGQT
jgi:polar amino acid transport system permease protein